MKRYMGKSVCQGIAVGRIYWYRKKKDTVKKHSVIDIAGEMNRLENALFTADEQLKKLYEDTKKKAGEEQALIFEIHRMMLEDADYLEAIKKLIAKGTNAEYAVDVAKEQFAQLFAAMDDAYMKERAADIKDVSDRVIQILTGTYEELLDTNEAVIVVADDLSPSETVRMDREKILAFVTVKGSGNSHTAILARSMNLPALVSTRIELSEELDGKMAVVDGFAGELMVEPDEALLLEMTARRKKWTMDMDELLLLKGQENITSDGRKIEIYANIGNVEDADRALDADAGGIGLFRSEFLYLGKKQFPTEEEQFESYKAVLEKMAGKKVIIRTLDIGADKTADYFGLEKEENPALGYRAIRICLDRPEILITQLRAIYRAAVYGTAAIMFPMIISTDEITRIKEIVKQVKKQLQTEGCPIGEAELGIMIETPAAALIADSLAKEVDFFSIGTNDLTQYTLAIDRQNEKLENYCNVHHPAVLKLIEMTVKSGHDAGIWVGICGELAADTKLTSTFLTMGVDELSVSPSSVLKVRKAVREL